MIYGRAKVEGVSQLISKMKQTQEEIHSAIKKGIDRTAIAIESDAKRKITTDGHIITGRLRASIHAELKNDQSFSYKDKKGQEFDGALEEELGKQEAVVGTNVHYAPYIEYGTKYTAADSFLGWAALKHGKLIADRILQELGRIRT